METLIIVVIIFGLLVSIHELGHLIVAKRSGILCREYAIGFGPKLFAIKRGETVYTLRLLPIGGYVRMAGEDPETFEVKPGQSIGIFLNDRNQVTRIVSDHLEKYPNARFLTVEHCDLDKELYLSGYEEENGPLIQYAIDRQATYVSDHQDFQIAPHDRQFASKPLLARFLTIFAGPFMNLVLAVVIFIIYFSIQGVPSNQPQLGTVIDGYSAQKYGLVSGDRILQIDGQGIKSWQDIAGYVSKHPKQKIEMTVERNGEQQQIELLTGERKGANGKPEGMIGVYQPTIHSFAASIGAGFSQTYYWIKMEFVGLKMLISGGFDLNNLAGPVGIYNATGAVVSQGLFFVLNWTAFLSVNLAVINLLPLPALDGGRLMFIIFEALRGKPIEPQKEALVHFIGFAFLMILMLLVTWNDLQNLFTR
ncbi:RIP metalloprotease RseP [Sporolactobacillus terrae]|uniref:Zinc metalloprotease n=1 Tax=Sporolactobacillus terrae TaxID=269673 RepID=A0ABX5Q6V5_9BACL|nr:RIP metalloprotease RseP [Sporolactobacillus terrae]QAA22374.1 RIP metalloprotease RseP [Sporolactobacillus terrae]QAA25350.1 RIP metalloprotease RseP [Sporolactobacillus terrae]UAK17159.1 RIP metalloprotease RseP [Sporolactobacillus terrae]